MHIDINHDIFHLAFNLQESGQQSTQPKPGQSAPQAPPPPQPAGAPPLSGKTCPNCGLPELFLDSAQGKFICRNCGYVQGSGQATRRRKGTGKGILVAAVVLLVVIALAYTSLAYLGKTATKTTTASTTSISTSTTIQPTAYSISSCTQITSPGTYRLTSNINARATLGPCINISSSNVRLLGQGNKIVGNGPFIAVPPFTQGIVANGLTNVTISNLSVSKFSYDILFSSVTFSTISNVIALNATMSGVFLNNSFNNNLQNVQVFSTAYQQGGIGLKNGGNNLLANIVSLNNAYYGLYLNSSSAKIMNSTFRFNPLDLYCGVQSIFKTSDQFTNNRCDRNTFCNFAQCAQSNVPSNISLVVLPKQIQTCGSIRSGGSYYVSGNLNLSNYLNTSNPLSRAEPCILINAPNVKLDCGKNTILNSWQGVLVNGVFNAVVQNCSFYNDTYGVAVANSFNVNVTNIAAAKGTYGLYFMNSTTGTVTNATAYRNKYGIYINSTTGFAFRNMNMTNNTYGVFENSGVNQFVNGRALSNSRADLYCGISTYNSTINILQGLACGVTDCNWGNSCPVKILPPLPSVPVFRCANLNVSGSYKMNSSILTSGGGSCININSDNVTLNCNNRIMASSGIGTAINVRNHNNVTIQNCRINNFGNAVNITNSRFFTLRNMTISNMILGGVIVNGGTFGRVSNVNVTSFRTQGFLFAGVNSTIITNNTAKLGILSATGFNFSNDFKNIVKNNNASSNSGFGFAFNNNTRINTISNNSAFSNSVFDYSCLGNSAGLYAQNGGVNFGSTKSRCVWEVELNSQVPPPSCYAISTATQINLQQDMLYSYGGTCFSIYNTNRSMGSGSTINCGGHTVLANKGGVFVNIINASGVRVQNCFLKGFPVAIESSATGTTVINNTITGSNYPIIINATPYPTIIKNGITNSSTGLLLQQNVNYGLIQNNTFANDNTSIEIVGGTGNKIFNNTALQNTNYGLYLINTFTNTVQGNNLLSKIYGIICSQAAANSGSNMDFGGNICSHNWACSWITQSALCKSP